MGVVNRETLRDGLAAGSLAAVVSGAPSTAHALVTGKSPMEASLAAGTLLLPDERRPGRLLLAATPVHIALSLAWALLLAVALPRRRTALWSALAGLGIAALDLRLVGRRFPRIRALPQLPQVADHLRTAQRSGPPWPRAAGGDPPPRVRCSGRGRPGRAPPEVIRRCPWTSAG